MSGMTDIRENYAEWSAEEAHTRKAYEEWKNEAYATFDEMIRSVREQAWDQGALGAALRANGESIQNPFRPRDIDMTANQRAAEGLI